MFYTIYDAVVFKAKESGIEECEVKKILQKKGINSEQMRYLKNSCTTLLPEDILNIIYDQFGLTCLEIDLMLGNIPKEYEKSYLNSLSVIAGMLEKEKVQKRKGRKKSKIEFETNRGKLYHADCLDILPQIEEGTVDLIFADPPFNLKKEYANGRSDDLSISEYLNWSQKWIDECVIILKPGGSLYIYNIPKWCVYYGEYLNSKLCFQNWIAIDMKNSFPIKDKYTASHYGLLYYTKGEKAKTFNKQRLPIQTCRHCGGEYKDYGGYKYKMNKLGVNIADVWYDIFPVRKGKNRLYNELAVKLLDRVISFSSNEEDLILDPFGGSGTTYAVAELLNRKWIGMELGDCKVIKNRILSPQKDKELLKKISEEKNVLFTKKSIKLRKKNGFWLPKEEE